MNVNGLNNRDLTATIRDVMRRHEYLVLNDSRMLPYIAFVATDQKTHARVFVHSDGEVGVVLLFRTSNGINVQTDEFQIDASDLWLTALAHLTDARLAIKEQ